MLCPGDCASITSQVQQAQAKADADTSEDVSTNSITCVLQTGCFILVFCLSASTAPHWLMEKMARLPAMSCLECGTALCALSSGTLCSQLRRLTGSQRRHLRCRGPGDFLGKQQSGHDGLKCLNAARLPEDMRLLDQARSVAADLIARHGLNPSQWPLPLLASLKDTRLPSLELKTLPANAIAQSLQWLDDKL